VRRIIVDNGSKHIRELVRLCGPSVSQVVSPSQLSHVNDQPGTLYVLSGGHHKPVLGNDDYYRAELDLIEEAKHPIVGVCLGFELIAYAAGSTLVRLDRGQKGIVEVFPTPEGTELLGPYSLSLSVGHRWAVTEPPPGYVTLATSQTGIEAIGNLSKRIVGFQFHPEYAPEGTDANGVFERLVDRLSRT
jgi:GMP synthase-like glutamine amidotransferase